MLFGLLAQPTFLFFHILSPIYSRFELLTSCSCETQPVCSSMNNQHGSRMSHSKLSTVLSNIKLITALPHLWPGSTAIM
ncbi:hypothetical protein BJ878DRAFT_145266 [Calycina marina]|uniref:Uncharacterized protein n=1 Tax=Calycina marina TaxID=1763456 RepID=A0A9P7Z053_9HELO|nr:hypothetical protein BJ878DRAFT_145266 [Calycina marina]